MMTESIFLDILSASWFEQLDLISVHDIGIQKSSYIYADCQSSFRGIFVGLLLVIMTIVFVILLFVGFQNRCGLYFFKFQLLKI